MDVQVKIVNVSRELLPFIRTSVIDPLEMCHRAVHLAHCHANISVFHETTKYGVDESTLISLCTMEDQAGKTLVLILSAEYLFVSGYELRIMLQKATAGYCSRLMDVTGNIVAIASNATDTRKYFDITLPNFRSLCLQSAFDVLMAEDILRAWPKYYFNEGYSTYWKKRIIINSGQADQVPNNDVFQYIFTIAVEYFTINNMRLLDVGCGDGRLFGIYSQASFEVFGVDIALDMVIGARATGNPNIHYGTLEDTGQPENAFGMIVAWGVLDSTQQDSALHHLMGRLERGGILLCSGKNSNYYPDDTQAMISEYNAALKLFPNGFSNIDTLTAAIHSYGGEIRHKLYAPYRGDLARGDMTSDAPEHFYEWVLIIEKTSDTPNFVKYSEISASTSAHFSTAQKLFGSYDAWTGS